MKFINRDKELKSLKEKWKSQKAEFFIIYGKRRVGKTELIKQFIKDKSSIYFLADKRNTKEQLKELGEIAGNYFNDQILRSRGFNDWIEVFSYLKSKIKKRTVFVVDEYPYLVENDSSTSSLFQKGWDEYLKDTNKDQEYWLAPGSRQPVYKKGNFIPKAKKAKPDKKNN